jgi:anti-sigma-K factor RskA
VQGSRAPRWTTWLGAAAAAALIAGAGAVGFRAIVDDDQQLDQAVVAVFEAEDAKTATVETSNGGELTVAVSKSNDEMAVDTRALPELDDQQVYQIWAVHGDEMVSAAILSDPAEGAAMGLPNGATEVALTVEPSGGSEQPTTSPIVQLDPYDVLAT